MNCKIIILVLFSTTTKLWTNCTQIMKRCYIRNDELWYTDNPYRDKDRLAKLLTEKTFEPIVVYTAPRLVDVHKGSLRKYAIVDGNRRALVNAVRKRENTAHIIQTCTDLSVVLDRLVSDHALKRQDVRTLADLENALFRRMQELYQKGQPLFYDS